MKTESIKFGDGKYEIQLSPYGVMTAYRHGEPWPVKTADLVGDKCTLCLLYKVLELREEVASLEQRLGINKWL